MKRYKIWLGLAMVHLFIVALGSAIDDFSPSGFIGNALEFYASLSGAGDGYSFFAPGVFSQLGATFDITDINGKKTTEVLQDNSSHEANLRLGGIIDQFQSEADDPVSFRRALAASLVGRVFGFHPDARRVTVNLREFKTVSLADYERGIRPGWESIYSATFEKSGGRNQ